MMACLLGSAERSSHPALERSALPLKSECLFIRRAKPEQNAFVSASKPDQGSQEASARTHSLMSLLSLWPIPKRLHRVPDLQ